jgi:plasmid stabilization system protein ParE
MDKKFELIWSPEALDQLIEILTYLDTQSLHAAGIVKNEILEQLELLRTNPTLGAIDRL